MADKKGDVAPWDGSPALNAIEWSTQWAGDESNDVGLLPDGRMRCVWRGANLVVPNRSRHAHAAIALFGMPFSFDVTHVVVLTRVISDMEACGATGATASALCEIRDLIAALLPPSAHA